MVVFFVCTKALIVNGEEKQLPYTATLSGTQRNWLITPQGTAYYLPSVNDDIQIVYGAQKTPYETGTDVASPVTTATYIFKQRTV